MLVLGPQNIFSGPFTPKGQGGQSLQMTKKPMKNPTGVQWFGTDFHGFLKLLPPSTGPLKGLESSKRAKNIRNRKTTIF